MASLVILLALALQDAPKAAVAAWDTVAPASDLTQRSAWKAGSRGIPRHYIGAPYH